MKRIRNYVQSLPDIATSGQPAKEQFREIAKEGYAIIINLAMPDHHDSIENEGKIITELGMIYFHLPVPFDKPTREHVRIFCRIMAALTGKKIWVHCIMNYRVSAFMFHYLNKIIGLDESDAMASIFRDWKPDNRWQEIFSLTADEIGL